MDQNPNEQDLNLDEELELDLELDDNNEDVVTLSKEEYAKLSKRAKAVPQLTKRLNDLKNQPRINKQEEPKQFQIDEEVELRLDGFTKDEAKFILSNGGRKTLEDKNSYVAVAINTIREQKKAEQAASAIDDTSGLSEVERKFTPEQLAEMSQEELAKVLPHAE